MTPSGPCFWVDESHEICSACAAPEDRNCLSWWFPRIAAAGLPVPRTEIVEMPAGAREAVWRAFDGEEGGDPEETARFLKDLRTACESVGFPAFLRTGHAAGKHSWKETCCVRRDSVLARHVFRLAEYCEIAGILGLPWTVWVVREMLPVETFGTCPRYGDMPVAREFRAFVEDGRLRCLHPYWPPVALEQGGAEGIDYEALCRLDAGERGEVARLAEAAGRAVGGAWSVDLLATARGWHVTDMAEAHASFHWEGCPEAARFGRAGPP
jgi:hypothetical protein